MPLIIETGAIVANANSYGVTDGPATIAAARAYALLRGAALSADDAVVTAYLVKGTDYIESFASRFVGMPTTVTQLLSWPRQSVQLSDGSLLDSHTLPIALLNALYQLGMNQQSGIILMPNDDPASGGYVIRERVDVIETEYSERVGTTKEPILRAFDSLISSLLYTSSAFGFRTIRV